MTTACQLQVKKLHKTYSDDLLKTKKHVLKGVDLEVGKGEIYGFLGPNGAGKTTTIKAITGLIIPDSGEISICNKPHTSVAAKRQMGFMPEQPSFYNHLTGHELLLFYSDLIGLARADATKRIDKLLHQVGLTDHAQAKVKTYSKGMLQRMALAQALINQPKLLILDEPLSGLDPIGRRDFREIILELKEEGVTIFFSSHIIPDVENICDRVGILIDGRLQAEGEVQEIINLKVDHYDITFTGVPPGSLKTELVAEHEGSDSVWARVTNDLKDRLVSEITSAGGNLISLNPVTSSLEDVLISKYEESK